MTFDVERYVALLQFAAHRHADQKTPVDAAGRAFPYVVHVTSVTAELIAILPAAGIDGDLAIGCALLHDTIEDTAKPYAEKVALADDIEARFGKPIRDGVWALTKIGELSDGTIVDKPAQMIDSLERIRAQPHAVWAVKLADRITNLQPPPKKWDVPKCERYLGEARQILDALGAGCEPLATRLRAKIERYPSTWNR